MITQHDQQSVAANAAHARRVQAGLQDVHDHFSDIPWCEAADNLIRRWCSEFSGTHDVVPSAALFQVARDANRQQWHQEFSGVLKPIRKQIEGLISQILEMLRTHGSHTEVSLQALLKNKLAWMTRDQLIVYRDEIARKQSLNKVPVKDLKKSVADFRAREARMQDTLPPEITLEVIKSAPVEKIKFWIRRYGAAAVNARINGEI